MSRKRKTSHTRNHELENERSTRKSARLNNPHSINHSKSKILERKKITKLQRNILKTCPGLESCVLFQIVRMLKAISPI
jgi:hypothetical protein